ncbi:MAG TPA: hypothetical protein VNC84_07475 [Gammaproteobacteria bacterium]|jgi:hypothetical protein|nr:hypothetical protein [Gammaproteobacteria bacterium]
MLRLFGGRGYYEALPLDENAIDQNEQSKMASFVKNLSGTLDQIAAAKAAAIATNKQAEEMRTLGKVLLTFLEIYEAFKSFPGILDKIATTEAAAIATNKQAEEMRSQGKALLTFLETCETHLASLRIYLNKYKEYLPRSENYCFYLAEHEETCIYSALIRLNYLINTIATNNNAPEKIVLSIKLSITRLSCAQNTLSNPRWLTRDRKRQWRDERWWETVWRISLLFAVALLTSIIFSCIMIALFPPARTSSPYPKDQFIIAACTLPPTSIGLYAVRKKQQRLKYKHYIENDSYAQTGRLFRTIKDAAEELLNVYLKPTYSQNGIAIP